MYSQKLSFLALLAIGAALMFALRGVIAWPAPPPTPRADQHIVSFVHQKRLKASKHNDELINYHFENIRNELDGNETADMNRLLSGQDVKGGNSTNVEKSQRLQQSQQYQQQKTDDSIDTRQNTLMDMNGLFDDNEHHESPGMTNVTWQRNKQSIPVLATVKHLVNSLQNGTLNHTIPTQHNNHNQHQLIGAKHNATMGGAGNAGTAEHKPIGNMEDNSAIETEEERVHTEESTEFQLLEVLGSFGSILWNFLMNIQKFFAASSGGASSTSSSQASASSSGGGGAR